MSHLKMGLGCTWKTYKQLHARLLFQHLSFNEWPGTFQTYYDSLHNNDICSIIIILTKRSGRCTDTHCQRPYQNRSRYTEPALEWDTASIRGIVIGVGTGGARGTLAPSPTFGLIHISRFRQDPSSFAHTIPWYWPLTNLWGVLRNS